MDFLLDTCVLSEFVKPQPSALVQNWMAAQAEDRLFVAALSLAELHRGVARLPASKRRQELAAWLTQLEAGFADRVLPFTGQTAGYWGVLAARAESRGEKLSAFDSLIAATAAEHGLALVTRNEKDFAAAAVVLINPWLLEA